MPVASRSTPSIAAVATLVAACGAASTAPSATTPCPDSRAATESGASAEVSDLLVDLLSPQLCPRLEGSFIGLPGDDAGHGPAAGADPTTGRWWIRRCEAHAHDGQLRLVLSGMGWTFVDRQSSGFRVRQYLRFDATAELNATMEVGYDARHKVASLWMRPGQNVTASVTPRGLVTANATGVFSAIAGGLLSLSGGSADDVARTQAQEQGSAQLRERLSAGFTLTFDVERGQLDFMVGALARGQTPLRPYEGGAGGTWQVNQRSRVWPGGLDVVGPLDLSQGAQQLDVELEDGERAVLRTVCAEELSRYLDASFQGAQPTPPTGRVIAELNASSRAARAQLETNACPIVLLLSAAPDALAPVRLRYRVGVPGAADAPANEPPSLPAQSTTSTTRLTPPATFRIQIARVTIRPTNASGRAWDVIGGDADIYVRVSSVPDRREIDRTPTHDDSVEAVMNHWLAGAIRPEMLPLRFSVYDKDVTTDELIGTVDLPLSGIGAAHGELILDLLSQTEPPVRVGSVQLRVEPLR